MKFFTMFTALISALSIGVLSAPVNSSNHVVREPVVDHVTVETPNFKRMKQEKSGMVAGRTYVFTQTIPKGAHEKNKKVKDLENALGYKHIYLVVGHVTSIPVTKVISKTKTKVTTTWDFIGHEFDMFQTGPHQYQNGHFEPPRAWSSGYAASKSLAYVKETTKTDK